ncbi:MAG: twin-arginine translocase TatA/TatE family subunit [Candidatus Marinimicrobia bacterium]|jgi:sec-independent protein translocase protein TatA|nr:twin-arginine translocase TatA/TatE family subunit [Candidatus Neomarinimicrobiota bacterium]MBT3496213.1 twin-arginine translocase TatA/TatE family subunit [Candidatus Neomarinimicrobiota bacterium]MBT3693061.1 twin-arginine translocase TatA/TatE family subunit [Candidatus Neomarinimicrobiota bacterium]MBT3732775.1 twin-arginine translocase TatA/TatE family subunit [Candidatus Neomarinimicrobiota bacterium]MBT4143925.1 twin-arginine translocase TatA/TatE family subunit [Candidatus Neomarini
MTNQNEVLYAVFNLGTGEIVLILLIVLLLFGAKRLPELAKGLGKGISEFKGAVDGAKKEINDIEETVKKSADNDEDKSEK